MIPDMLFTEVGVVLLSKVVQLVDKIELNRWVNGREKERLPLLLSTMVIRHTKFSDTLPFLICRDSRYGRTGVTCYSRKDPTAYSISNLVGFIKDLGFRRIILTCGSEPSMKSLQDAVMQACAGVEVIHRVHLRVITWPTVVWTWLYEQ